MARTTDLGRPPAGRGRLTAILLAYHVLIGLAWVGVIAPVYAYTGYVTRQPSYLEALSGALLGAVPALWLPLRPARPSHVVLLVLQVLVISPLCAVAPYLGMWPYWQSMAFAAWTVLAFATSSLVLLLPRLRLPRPGRHPALAWGAVLGGFGLCLLAGIATYGTPNRVLSLGSVYDQRYLAREVSASASFGVAYLIVWLQNVFSPLLLAAALLRRRWSLAVLGLMGIFFVYSALGNRSALLAVPGAAVLYAAVRRRWRSSSVVVGAGGVFGGAVAAYAVTGSTLTLGTIADRLFTLPPILGTYYFDYFGSRSPLMLRDGLFSFLASSPYDTTVQFLISDHYFNQPESTSNVNVFADSFGNFWFAGLVVALALGLLLWVLDGISEHCDPAAVCASLVLMTIALSNMGLHTALLTAGIGPMVVILYLAGPTLLPRRTEARTVGRAGRTGPAGVSPGRARPAAPPASAAALSGATPAADR